MQKNSAKREKAFLVGTVLRGITLSQVEEQFEELTKLYKRLAQPGQDKIWIAARKSKMTKLTKTDIKDLIGQYGSGTMGIFRDVVPSKGKSVATAPHQRCQADLIDYKNNHVFLVKKNIPLYYV